MKETPPCETTAKIAETETKEISENAETCKLKTKKAKRHHNKDPDSKLDFCPIIEEDVEGLELMVSEYDYFY